MTRTNIYGIQSTFSSKTEPTPSRNKTSQRAALSTFCFADKSALTPMKSASEVSDTNFYSPINYMGLDGSQPNKKSRYGEPDLSTTEIDTSSENEDFPTPARKSSHPGGDTNFSSLPKIPSFRGSSEVAKESRTPLYTSCKQMSRSAKTVDDEMQLEKATSHTDDTNRAKVASHLTSSIMKKPTLQPLTTTTSFLQSFFQQQRQQRLQSRQQQNAQVNALQSRKTADTLPKLLPKPTSDNMEKPCLVLDLDETLVHSTFEEPFRFDFMINITIDSQDFDIYTSIRPGAVEFLQEAAKHFELVIFTASLARYADPVIDRIDPQRVVSHRLFRESCVFQDNLYLKDLSKLGRSLARTLIVDNSPAAYSLQPENAIPITSWFNDICDVQIEALTLYLKKIVNASDVREAMADLRQQDLCRSPYSPNGSQPEPHLLNQMFHSQLSLDAQILTLN